MIDSPGVEFKSRRWGFEQILSVGITPICSDRIELLDRLSFSYIKASDCGDPVHEAAKELIAARDVLAKEHAICTCCYQPMEVCPCDMPPIEG